MGTGGSGMGALPKVTAGTQQPGIWTFLILKFLDYIQTKKTHIFFRTVQSQFLDLCNYTQGPQGRCPVLHTELADRHLPQPPTPFASIPVPS